MLEEALGRGATVVQTYGLTEACSQVCTLGPEEARERAGSAGRPLDGTEVRIEDDEILVRGPTVAPGLVAADGWLHTGDLGRLDEDGYLWVEGRRDDLIVSGGENVRPERVEAALREHPAVADVGRRRRSRIASGGRPSSPSWSPTGQRDARAAKSCSLTRGRGSSGTRSRSGSSWSRTCPARPRGR